MTKSKGKKKSAQTDELSETKDPRCTWSLADENVLIAYIASNRAKGGDGMNFDKTFWTAAAAELASKSTGAGSAKSPDACQQKWGRVCIHFNCMWSCC